MSDEQEKDELLPCPFCGSPADYVANSIHGIANCTNEECWAEIEGGTKKEAKKRWNRRPAPVGVDEREAFEKWLSGDKSWLIPVEKDGTYSLERDRCFWLAWQARSRQSPAASEGEQVIFGGRMHGKQLIADLTMLVARMARKLKGHDDVLAGQATEFLTRKKLMNPLRDELPPEPPADDVVRALETLREIQQTIENSDHWWMDCPDKGGFDTDKIDAAIAALRQQSPAPASDEANKVVRFQDHDGTIVEYSKEARSAVQAARVGGAAVAARQQRHENMIQGVGRTFEKIKQEHLAQQVSPPAAMGELPPIPSDFMALVKKFSSSFTLRNHEEVAELTAALEVKMKEYGQLCQQGGGWRAIGSAPKDDNDILVVSQIGTRAVITGWYLHNMIAAGKKDGDGCFYVGWMPLPAPPQSSEGGEAK